jgi:hypothetical protein
MSMIDVKVAAVEQVTPLVKRFQVEAMWLYL